jgi:GAF domain-containing protein
MQKPEDAPRPPFSELGEMNELLWALPTTLDPQAIATVLLDKTTRLFQAPLGCVWARQNSNFELVHAHGFTPKKALQLMDGLKLRERPHLPLKLQGPELPAFAGFGKRRLGALLALPIMTPDDFQGWIVLARFENAPFTDFEVQFLSLITSRVALSFENARLYQETRARTLELELLYEIAQLIVRTSRLDELLELLIRRMTETFELSGCMIRLYDDKSDTLPLAAQFFREAALYQRMIAHAQNTPHPAHQGRTGAAFMNNTPFICANIQTDPLFDPIYKELLGKGSMIAVPLQAREKPIGILYWFRNDKLPALSPADMPLLVHLGHQVALAIDKAQLLEALERQAGSSPSPELNQESLGK